MDKPIDGRARKRLRFIKLLAAAILLLAILLYFAFIDVHSKLNVDLDKITIEKARKDLFLDYIAMIGTVEPIQTVYLDATEGGRIEEIYAREGARLKKRDKILRISNDNLLLEISNYETEVARAVNDLKSMRVTLENQLNANQSQLVEYYYDLCKLGRDLTNNTRLVKSGIISQDDFELSRENYERKKKLYELLSKKSELDSSTIASRIAASEESVESMQKNLGIIRSRLTKLVLTSPVDGELATLNPELGQVIAYGSRVGTISILDSYKIKADVDEHYISRVRPKLKASCEFSSKEYAAILSKVYPAVKGGTFSVDLVFCDTVPPEIRIGQTARIRLELGESGAAILVGRGGFYQSTGGQWVYVVDRGANTAIKRAIRIGRQNPSCYEVLEGLEPNEEVITSGYETFGKADKLVLRGSRRP